MTKEWEGSRLDRFVRAVLPDTPFGVIHMLVRKGRIFLNDKKTDGGARLKAGDVIAIQIEEIDEGDAGKSGKRSGRTRKRAADAGTKAPAPAPKRYSDEPKSPVYPQGRIGEGIGIVYEDDSLLAIDKPAGMVVQPGNRKDKGSLLDLLEEYRRRTIATAGWTDARSKTAGESEIAVAPPFRYTPVHRLDRDTSGVLLVAKTRKAARALSLSIARRMVSKEYVAVVEGVPSVKTGEITAPLATRKDTRSHSTPAANGRSARTQYSVVRELPGNRALVKVTIDTGRTHQIRAHLASIGHPIVGDREYGPAGAGPRRRGRMLLHAWRIRFSHPETGATIVAMAPPPEEFGLNDE